MIAAVLASAAVWCAVAPSVEHRRRSLFGPARTHRRPPPALLAALATPVAALVVLGWPLGLVAGAGIAPLAHRVVGRLETAAVRERTQRVVVQLPGALDLMVTALEVGRPPAVALVLAASATPAPLGDELGALASRLQVAGDPILVWEAVLSDPVLGVLGRAMRRAESSGMPVAQVISGAADDLRREHRARRREDSRKVAVRTAAPLGVCFLPAFFLIGIVPTVMGAFQGLAL